MNNKVNLVCLGDSYKYSHASQYPSNMVSMYSYMEARSSKLYDKVCFVGLQYYLDILALGIATSDVLEARSYALQHGVPFDYDGWMYIATKLNGKLPIKIKALAEGTIAPLSVPLLVIESTDEQVPWIAGWTETLLMKIWYPTTVATKSLHVREMLERYGSPEWAQFAYHNFGDRGSTSIEAAAIGGYAHLAAGLMGTDNFNALKLCNDTYNEPMAGYSVFATEHSTTTSYGRDNEEQFVYDKLMENPDAPIMSFVADSYDVYTFTDFCTAPDSRIRKLIESRPHQKFIFRPDSGEPLEVLSNMLAMLSNNNLNHTVNANGNCLFTDFGILWGDGITPKTIESILQNVLDMDFAAENFVFGSGGDLMQNVSRDTLGFAVKCSSITVTDKLADGMGNITYSNIDVFKDPITDPGKRSKRGRVTTYRSESSGLLYAGTEPSESDLEALVPVFEDGRLLGRTDMKSIRSNAKS